MKLQHVLQILLSKKMMRLLVTGVLLTVLGGVIVSLTQEPEIVRATNHNNGILSGFAWSDNIGWVSMNCDQTAVGGINTCASSNYHVAINSSGFTVEGYAWSDNIGWIHFDHGRNDCPQPGDCEATFSTADGEFRGWALAESAGDGWDGWIALNCESTADNCVSSTYQLSATNGNFDPGSFAWGDDVVGWLNFSMVSHADICTPTLACTSPTLLEGTDSDCQPQSIDCQAQVPVGTLWCNANINACDVLDVTAALTVSPLAVRPGETVSIQWNVSENVVGCRVTGTNGETWGTLPTAFDDLTGNSADNQSSAPIEAETVFTLECMKLDESIETFGEETVQIIPVFQEV